MFILSQILRSMILVMAASNYKRSMPLGLTPTSRKPTDALCREYTSINPFWSKNPEIDHPKFWQFKDWGYYHKSMSTQTYNMTSSALIHKFSANNINAITPLKQVLIGSDFFMSQCFMDYVDFSESYFLQTKLTRKIWSHVLGARCCQWVEVVLT